ncbi:MAG: alpha/beta hydrolase [Stagnimonas sp.]|nr:alpha/beta hydrolase [Stagnimonas sp.]
MSRTPTWVLLRGLMRDSRHWGDFPQTLRAALPGSEVRLLDLPGNGLRHREQSPASVPAMAEWVRAELRRQGVAPPYRVFAMSLGAMVTVAWADTHPQELETAVLANTSLRPVSPFYQRLQPAAWPLLLRMALTNPDARAAETAILQLTSRHLDQTHSVLEDWTRWRLSHPVSRANALRQLLAAMRFAAPKRAPKTRLLLLTGARDKLVDTCCSQALAKAWGCELAVHPTAGHDLPLDDAAWVAQQLARWEHR